MTKAKNAMKSMEGQQSIISAEKPSPRTKAKELIGETLANLRKRAKPFAEIKTRDNNIVEPSTSSSSSLSMKKSGALPLSQIQTNLSSRTPRLGDMHNNIGQDDGSRTRGGGEVTQLLKDATLLHKKIDALIEIDQNVDRAKQQQSTSQEEGASTHIPENVHFIDRLYHSLAKLKHLERSRNKMALCADSMETSVKSLNRFVKQVHSEKDKKEKQQIEQKANAKAVIKTNASLLSTEITLLLRSYAVEQKQIDHIKGSITQFIDTVFQQMNQL